MDLRMDVRGFGLRAIALTGCLVTAGTAYTAAPAALGGPEAGVTVAGAGDHRTVRYGDRVEITGTVTPAAPDHGVQLQHAPRGRAWRPVAETRTRAGGVFRFTARARHSGTYRVTSDTGHASGRRRVAVAAHVAARSTRHARGGSRVLVRGVLRPRVGGRPVRVQLRLHRRWRTVGRARTNRRGRFQAAWRPTAPGRFRLRVRFPGDRLNSGVRRVLGRRLYVYRAGRASWYGPGLYGGRTACGQRLGEGTLGVAHKALPCGTPVTFRYRGRSVTVRVIDRGPYGGGREWDLTGATRWRLGFPSTGVVWATR